jgi:drug/metabolite transporter (DMT)-like permease
MRVQHTTISKGHNRIVRYVYLITVLFLTLTGFGQMPIFKRYYIADIPGLGWLAQFYVTHYIHYLAAILILALVAYLIVDYLILQKKHLRLTASGYVRGAILAGILVSGIFLVIRNLTGRQFGPQFIIFLDLAHLGLVMTFLMVVAYCLIFKKQWTNAR